MLFLSKMLCFLVVLILVGCLPGAFTVSADVSQSGIADLNVDGVSGNCGLSNGAAIQSVWVGKVQADGKAQTVWQLKSIDVNGHQLKSIRYGVIPDGFVEQEKPSALIAGAQYDAELSGHGCSGGIKFAIR
jgi:hypothetical protein